jgi:hypothetical protein
MDGVMPDYARNVPSDLSDPYVLLNPRRGLILATSADSRPVVVMPNTHALELVRPGPGPLAFICAPAFQLRSPVEGEMTVVPPGESFLIYSNAATKAMLTFVPDPSVAEKVRILSEGHELSSSTETNGSVMVPVELAAGARQFVLDPGSHAHTVFHLGLRLESTAH